MFKTKRCQKKLKMKGAAKKVATKFHPPCRWEFAQFAQFHPTGWHSRPPHFTPVVDASSLNVTKFAPFHPSKFSSHSSSPIFMQLVYASSPNFTQLGNCTSAQTKNFPKRLRKKKFKIFGQHSSHAGDVDCVSHTTPKRTWKTKVSFWSVNKKKLALLEYVLLQALLECSQWVWFTELANDKKSKKLKTCFKSNQKEEVKKSGAEMLCFEVRLPIAAKYKQKAVYLELS